MLYLIRIDSEIQGYFSIGKYVTIIQHVKGSNTEKYVLKWYLSNLNIYSHILNLVNYEYKWFSQYDKEY